MEAQARKLAEEWLGWDPDAVTRKEIKDLVDASNWAELHKRLGSRITFTATPLLFASALVQYNSSTRSVSTNARLRWEYRPGSELFVVYNEERDSERAVLAPGLLNRSFVVKVNRFFRF